MATLFPILFVIVFVFIVGAIGYSVMNHFRNSRAPQQSSYARIVAKRMDVQHSSTMHSNNDNNFGHTTSSSRTYYYITLEFDNGSRQEFLDVKGLSGLVVEGDAGYAATKGEWIVAFERSAG
ncbi:DUF2500 domain-containing protein [Paenibacillus sp. GSMTC-2017]|nr:DUF2500 domain-containing protein [Paenibacillus sp. GSMTC-2017]